MLTPTVPPPCSPSGNPPSITEPDARKPVAVNALLLLLLCANTPSAHPAASPTSFDRHTSDQRAPPPTRQRACSAIHPSPPTSFLAVFHLPLSPDARPPSPFLIHKPLELCSTSNCSVAR